MGAGKRNQIMISFARSLVFLENLNYDLRKRFLSYRKIWRVKVWLTV